MIQQLLLSFFFENMRFFWRWINCIYIIMHLYLCITKLGHHFWHFDLIVHFQNFWAYLLKRLLITCNHDYSGNYLKINAVPLCSKLSFQIWKWIHSDDFLDLADASSRYIIGAKVARIMNDPMHKVNGKKSRW